MRIFKTKTQKNNTAKFLYDLAKITFAIAVISPTIKSFEGAIYFVCTGSIAVVFLFITAFFIDSKEIQNEQL